MRNLFWRGGLAIALVGALLWGRAVLIRADEADSSSSAGTRSGVLVLNNGQLVEGRLSQSAGGYVVDLPKGSFLVPFERVSVVAEDRHDAYKKLKAAQPTPTPEFQVGLARWCIAWKLFEEARLELRDALVADPDHKEGRRMYAKLDNLMHPERQTVASKLPKKKSTDGFQPAEPESLAGLSNELAKQYVIRVQPLLLNRCGNAACHGPASEQDFHITHVRRSMNRQTMENLKNVLGFVDVSAPEESRLLTALTGTHGRNGRRIFAGSVGEQNLETLKDWIAQIAKEHAAESEDKPQPNKYARLDQDLEPDETLIRGVPEDPQPATPKERTAQEKEELLNSILRNEQKDAFDPEEFNRKFGN